MSSVCLSRVCYSTRERGREREKERERERERGRGRKRERGRERTGVTNYKIVCFVLCLLCLEFVVSSVRLSRVCYSTKEIER